MFDPSQLTAMLSQVRHFQAMKPEERSEIIAIINPVIMFNEVPVLDGGPNVTTVIASQDCVVWLIPVPFFTCFSRSTPVVNLPCAVAAGPEYFNRSLIMLRNNGFIQCTREIICIVETDALAELACAEIT